MTQPIDLQAVNAAKKSGSPPRWLWGAVLTIAAGVAAEMWYEPNIETTDNAYINGPVVTMVGQVSGPVVELKVADNQHVNKGDRLLLIYPRPYEVELEQAKASLGLARLGVSQHAALVKAAAADVEQKRSVLAQARSDALRAHQLAPKGVLSQETVEKADTSVDKALAEVQSAEFKLAKAQAELGAPGDDNEAVKAAQAAVDAAQLKLDSCYIYAPFSGTVSNLSLQVGSMIQASLPLFAVIGDEQVWVDANFKETQLEHIKIGQPADVRVDMYPDHVLHGHVQSISGGSGTAFSLMPPQNATGNWVKITQRVPVKIVIDDRDSSLPLRIGTSADVKVHI